MKRMKKWICMAMCLLLVLIASSAQAATLSVTGSATVTAEPDQALVRLGVQETETDVTKAQAQVNEKINAILDALEKDETYPIASADITTASYDIYPRYNYDDTTGEQVLSGYRAECMLAIVVRDIEQVGKVIDAAFAAGANEMDSIQFRLEDSSLVNDQALTQALEDALHKAQLLAQAAGIDLADCEMNISASENTYVESGRNVMYAMADTKPSGATTVRAGQLEFTASVSLTYSDKK